jgi:enoyl-CoA hydratase/carnithine racemase
MASGYLSSHRPYVFALFADEQTKYEKRGRGLSVMTSFDSYKTKYDWAVLDRIDGILEIRLHTNGGSFVWDERPHAELASLLRDVGDDRANRVVILTGTGEHFCNTIQPGSFADVGKSSIWETHHFEGRRQIEALLDIEVPVIAAINGSSRIHGELLLLSDILIASDTTVFQDAPHYMSGVVPGDGANIVWMGVLGPNHGRYFLMTGEELGAEEAKRLGVVGEVLPYDEVMPRARELAAQFAKHSDLMLRYSRVLLTQEWRQKFSALQGYGLMMAGSAINDLTEGSASPISLSENINSSITG